MSPRPLDGYRVLDLSQNIAGPLAGQVLADLGADVLKVEPPTGEAARQITTPTGLAPFFLPYNRGKRSVVVDLRTPEGADRLLDLAESSDVLVEGFRPGTMRRWGLGPDRVHARNPRCVYASITGFGNGDHGSRPAVDLLLQAESGMLGQLRAADGAPIRIPYQVVDGATGHVLAQAVLAALLQRERHGLVEDVSVAMYDVAVHLQATRITMELNNSAQATASVGGAPYATSPSGIFRAADSYLVLAAYIPKHWTALTTVIDRPDLAVDPRFHDQESRARHDAELRTELEKSFATRPADDIIGQLQAAGLMAGKVSSWRDVVTSAVFGENELAVTVTDGERTETSVRTPARYSCTSPAAMSPTPLLGSHAPAPPL